jgi:hypothetical protein
MPEHIMLLEIAAAALIAAAPAPAPSSSAVPSAALTTPLREVVYNVSTSTLIDDITETFGGGDNAFSPPSTTEVASRNGTVTVDVMAKFDNGVLGIMIFEHWKVPPLPQAFTGGVAPDGTVEFPPSTIDPVTIELLPFFATQFAPPGSLATGTHWTVVKTYDKSVVSTDYTVTAVGPSSITIHKLTTIKALGSETIEGTVTYDPSSLAPISGKVRMKRTDVFADGQTQQTLDMTFDRLSDTVNATHKP